MSQTRPAPDATDIVWGAATSPSDPRAHRGLCTTCSHAETCENCGTPERPIFFCELFEVFGPPPVQLPPAPRPSVEEADAGEYSGLCMNCENRHTCALPRPAGGVWHCREYL